MCTRISFSDALGNVYVARAMDFFTPSMGIYGEFTQENNPWLNSFNIKNNFKGMCDVFSLNELNNAPLTEMQDCSLTKIISDIRNKDASNNDDTIILAINDGVNDKGLSIEGLFHKEATYAYEKTQNSMPMNLFCSKALATCDDIADVRAMLKDTIIYLEYDAEKAFTEHYALTDRTGQSIVIEFHNGVPKIMDNPIGTCTNSPSFDWHLENLRNYTQVQLNSITSNFIKGLEIHSTSYGSNLMGISAGADSVSRFVRATLFLSMALNKQIPQDRDSAFALADRVMGNVTVVDGVTAIQADDGRKTYDRTIWTAFKSLHDYDNAYMFKMEGDVNWIVPEPT